MLFQALEQIYLIAVVHVTVGSHFPFGFMHILFMLILFRLVIITTNRVYMSNSKDSSSPMAAVG